MVVAETTRLEINMGYRDYSSWPEATPLERLCTRLLILFVFTALAFLASGIYLSYLIISVEVWSFAFSKAWILTQLGWGMLIQFLFISSLFIFLYLTLLRKDEKWRKDLMKDD